MWKYSVAAKEMDTTTSERSLDADTHMAHDDATNNEGNAAGWDDDDYFWDEEYGTWVYMPQKRVRRRDLTNKKEKNWALGMRRNWDTEKYATMMENITIKRDELDTVTISHLACQHSATSTYSDDAFPLPRMVGVP